MSFLTRWLRPVDEIPVIRLDAHREIVAECEASLRSDLTAERERIAQLIGKNDKLSVEILMVKTDRDNLAAELAAIRPDAQKWRDRKKADREYRAEKRAQVNV